MTAVDAQEGVALRVSVKVADRHRIIARRDNPYSVELEGSRVVATYATFCPPEHVGQLAMTALPPSVLSGDSASYDVHPPGVGVPLAVGVGVGVRVAVGVGVRVAVGVGVCVAVGVGVAVAVGLGVPVGVGLGVPVPVGVGVGLAPAEVTGTQAENSDVLPPGSVAVAVIT